MNDISTSMRVMVLDTLALLASKEEQQKYQRDAFYIDVPAELFNQWEDCYVPQDINFRAGFVSSELDVLARFDRVLKQVSDDTPQQLPALEEFIRTEAWGKLSAAARDALSALGELPGHRG